MQKFIFNNVDELIAQAEKDLHTTYGLEFLKGLKEYIMQYNDLDMVLKNCPIKYRLWAVTMGYSQFETDLDLGQLTGKDWAWLLQCRPDYDKYCNWDVLEGEDWFSILQFRPELADFCYWHKLKDVHLNDILNCIPEIALKFYGLQ